MLGTLKTELIFVVYSLFVFVHRNCYKVKVQQQQHPFNGPLSGTTRVSQYNQSGLTGARDSEWQWHQLGHMQICTSPQTDNHASTPPFSFFTGWMPSCRPANSVKALKENYKVKGKKSLSHLEPLWPINAPYLAQSRQRSNDHGYAHGASVFCLLCLFTPSFHWYQIMLLGERGNRMQEMCRIFFILQQFCW